jgi:hypothetical protein
MKARPWTADTCSPLSQLMKKESRRNRRLPLPRWTDYRWDYFECFFECFLSFLRTGLRDSVLRLFDGTGVSLRKLIFGSFQFPRRLSAPTRRTLENQIEKPAKRT